MRHTLIFLLVIFFQSVQASYPSALPNNHLKEEITGQGDRVISKSIDWFSAAVDGNTYIRPLGSDDFYHGFGYWVQARTEFRPYEFFSLNMRSIFYSGSISFGYTKPTGEYHILGFSGRWPTQVLGGKLEVRAMDLERQNVGNGLVIEQKEMAGVILKWSNDSHEFQLRGDGTGSLVYDEDMLNAEFKIYYGLFGGGVIFWTATPEEINLGDNRDPYYYLTSEYQFQNGLSYALEAGTREEVYAALVALGWQADFSKLSFQSKLQGRYYDNNFGKDFVGMIEHMYVSYDQYDKSFTNTANVFVFDDNAYVYSLILNMQYDFSDSFSSQWLNEVGSFDFKERETESFYFYRFELSYFPILNREDALTLFVSNKVLTDSYRRPPQLYSQKNIILFHELDFIGLEASFRF